MTVIGVASGDRHVIDDRVVWGGSGWARLGQYIPHLTEHEWVCGTLVWDKDRFKIQSDDGETTTEPEIVFMHRLMHKGLYEHVKLARSYGQKIVNDLDDWYWGLDTANQAFYASHPKYNPNEDRYAYQKTLSNSDLVIVSTPYLADRVRQRIQAPIVVVENTVDLDRFKPHPVTDTDQPLVGWVGSTNHRSGDLEMMRGILGPLKRSNEIRLMHGGHHAKYRSFAEAIGVAEHEVDLLLPLADQEQYPKMLIMDIGIVPLRHTPFNQSKSYIKGLEYSAAGIPFVAQSIDAYVDLRVKHNLGIVVRKPDEWMKAIRRLRDTNYRREHSESALEMVRQKNITVGAIEMSAALSSL